MKKLCMIAALVIGMACLLPGRSLAQTDSPVYSVQTRYLTGQLDSTQRAQLVALLAEYHAKVTMKNEFVKSEHTLWHYWTSDSRELVTITVFPNWGAIEKAGDRDEQLEMAAWPDAKQRADFMHKMSGYFSHHSDALYHGIPKLDK